MQLSFYQLFFTFLIYSFLGWITEEIFALVKHGKIVNRGFLKGPLCPIYGFGMIIIIVCLSPIKNNILLLFLESVLITTLLELVTGYILERFFHTKWWDYSDMNFNFKGYICLTFSILWGLAGVFIMYIIQPNVVNFINKVPYDIGCIFLSLAGAFLAVDIITTLMSAANMYKSFSKFDELYQKTVEFKQKLEKNIRELDERHDEFFDERRETIEAQLEQVKDSLERLFSELHNKNKRFFNAFPKIGANERFSDFISTYNKHEKEHENTKENNKQHK